MRMAAAAGYAWLASIMRRMSSPMAFAEGCYAADVLGDGEAADLGFHALEA